MSVGFAGVTEEMRTVTGMEVMAEAITEAVEIITAVAMAVAIATVADSEEAAAVAGETSEARTN